MSTTTTATSPSLKPWSTAMAIAAQQQQHGKNSTNFLSHTIGFSANREREGGCGVLTREEEQSGNSPIQHHLEERDDKIDNSNSGQREVGIRPSQQQQQQQSKAAASSTTIANRLNSISSIYGCSSLSSSPLLSTQRSSIFRTTPATPTTATSSSRLLYRSPALRSAAAAASKRSGPLTEILLPPLKTQQQQQRRGDAADGGEESETTAADAKSKNNHVIVFDLDETLCCNRGPGRAILRPGATELLRELAAHRDDLHRRNAKGQRTVEIVLWTASTQEVAQPVVNRLDPEGIFFDHKIFRDPRWFTTLADYTKDLRQLGRDMDSICIVENSPESVRLNRSNAILVRDFTRFSFRDTELSAVREILFDWIQKKDDFVPVADFLAQHALVCPRTRLVKNPLAPGSSSLSSSAIPKSTLSSLLSGKSAAASMYNRKSSLSSPGAQLSAVAATTSGSYRTRVF